MCLSFLHTLNLQFSRTDIDISPSPSTSGMHLLRYPGGARNQVQVELELPYLNNPSFFLSFFLSFSFSFFFFPSRLVALFCFETRNSNFDFFFCLKSDLINYFLSLYNNFFFFTFIFLPTYVYLLKLLCFSVFPPLSLSLSLSLSLFKTFLQVVATLYFSFPFQILNFLILGSRCKQDIFEELCTLNFRMLQIYN
ncbi:hypothetical protein DFH27DRAFT_95341 [Peziza echinospora]|nr:hypothetical protein DFH27DRAFT_95341 [Peziza echinospora]